MSLKWPPKDPDENLPFSIDWSRFLEGNNITNVSWFIFNSEGLKVPVNIGSSVDNLSVQGLTFTNTVAIIRLAGGVNRRSYRLACQVTYGTSSFVAERTVSLYIGQR